ncbi:MAG: hypothetical protein M1836_001031 [Candelina mexicana]|nr:MAG: hypothetical protein M1836_001031 [Candelina mexicana]
MKQSGIHRQNVLTNSPEVYKHPSHADKLKPLCVELSQVALRFGVQKASGKDIVNALEALYKTLQDEGLNKRLDEKLADYVFFPLSHVLKQSQTVPTRALELTLQCLLILLENGWRGKLDANLGQQLQILLCFLASGKSPSSGKTQAGQLSEELKVEALRCLSALFQCFALSTDAKASLTETANIPALGHTVTVILDGITEGTSKELQLSAVAALNAIYSCITHRETLANFFPGVVSSLTKALQPSTQMKRSYSILTSCLELLSAILRAVLEDTALSTTRKLSSTMSTTSSDKDGLLGPAWLRATVAQVKLALSNIIKLRNHDKIQVRHALRELCLIVLEHCRVSLADSAPMMIETLVILSTAKDADDGHASLHALEQIASSDPTLVDILRSSLHGWVVALPRVMQSNDETAKKRVISQITNSLGPLAKLEIDLSIIDRTLAASLRDSVTAANVVSAKQLSINEQVPESNSALAVISGSQSSVIQPFQPVLFGHRSQNETLQALEVLVEQLNTSGSLPVLARDMLEEVRSADGDAQLASFWLSLNMLRRTSTQNMNLEELIDYNSSIDPRTGLLEELYSFSLSILTESLSEEQLDWKMQCMAIETLAEHAQQSREEFKIELVDALYPLVHLVGSTNPQVRDHAMTCLNIVSKACGYSDTSDLIMSNVDYLVNAVALKLNTFDISPQAPQVLLMMIKLSGASLLPYLDDLVGSIFAALDCFHGYPRLVELLFSVLSGIVDEGAKAPMRAITSAPSINHRKDPFKPRSITDVASRLAQLKATTTKPEIHDVSDNDETESFPRKPWKSFNEEISQPDPSEAPDVDGDDPASAVASSETPTPLTKTHTMLLSITRLTQNYLTHSSPSLRSHLLSLASRSSDLLASHEDTFLPLINDIWPVVVKRLYDPEPFVCIAACQTIGNLCIGAGDFLSSRIETEWPAIAKLYWQVYERVKREKKGRDGRGTYTSNYQIWDALVGLFVIILNYVRVEDEIVDDVVAMVSDVLERRSDIREALEGVNPDVVWLELERRKAKNEGESNRKVPTLEGFIFKKIVF